MIWILLIFGSTIADKLNRGYLPPPAPNFSGGSLGGIDLPFEYLNSENNLENKPLKSSEIAIGINRVDPQKSLDKYENTYSDIYSLNSSFRPEISSRITTLAPLDNNYTPHAMSSNRLDTYSTHNLSELSNIYESNDKIFDVSFNSSRTETPLINDFLNNQYELKQQDRYVPISIPERINDEIDRKSVIINYENIITPESYAYSYDTSNNIHADESANTLNGVKAKGSYSYLGDDGKIYKVTYTADENGFRPFGDHLPTSPPIPDAILKVIEQAFRDKEAGIFDDGSYDERKYGYKNYPISVKGGNGYFTENLSGKNQSLYKKNEDLNKNINGIRERKNKENEDNGKVNKYRGPYKYENTNVNENQNFDKYTFHHVYNNSNGEQVRPQNNSNYDIAVDINNKTHIDVNDLTHSHMNQSDFNNKNYKIDYLLVPSGQDSAYYYNPPQYLRNELTSRLSHSKNSNSEKAKETNKASPKPFQTPYVTRQNEDLQEHCLSESFYEDLESDYEEKGSQNTHDDGFDYISDNNLKEKGKHPKGTDIYDHFLVSNNEYTYDQKALDANKNSKEPFTNNLLSMFPSKFTSNFNNIHINDSSFTSGTLPNVNHIINLSPETTLRSTFVNESGKNIPSHEEALNISYSIKAMSWNKSSPRLESTSIIPRFGTTYATYIDIIGDKFNEDAAKDNVKGENFSGLKQPQKFDADTGYYY